MLDQNVSLAIVYISIDELKPYERNARTHSRKQIRQIADSVKTFGFINPVIVDQNNRVMAGHGRVEAAKILSMSVVPTIRLDHLTEDQIRTYILADNKLAEKAGWDKEILAIEFQHLLTVESDLDITLTGFENSEIEMIIHGVASESETDIVEEMDLRETAVTKLGDLWCLDEHRLLCGDATKPEDIETLMNGNRAIMSFTDPPYNVDYVGKGQDGKHRPILNDALGDGFGSFLLAVSCNLLSATDGAIYICMSSSELHVLQAAFIKAGGHWSTFIIWAKNTFTLGRSDLQRQYEPILYGWREGAERKWCGARDQGDVWFFDKPARNDLHPTMKPVGLIMRAIRNSSDRNDLILDPFLGSGTTLIAAERTNRICYGMELEPLYVDTAVRRWQRHTGLKAIHALTGKYFDDIEEVAHVG